jgi:hypothetical protein
MIYISLSNWNKIVDINWQLILKEFENQSIFHKS